MSLIQVGFLIKLRQHAGNLVMIHCWVVPPRRNIHEDFALKILSSEALGDHGKLIKRVRFDQADQGEGARDEPTN